MELSAGSPTSRHLRVFDGSSTNTRLPPNSTPRGQPNLWRSLDTMGGHYSYSRILGVSPLDRLLARNHGQPLDLTRLLSIAAGLATALGKVHRCGLIQKDIKPANVLVDDAGNVWLTGFGIASQLPRERQSPVAPEIIAGGHPIAIRRLSPFDPGPRRRWLRVSARLQPRRLLGGEHFSSFRLASAHSS